MTGPQFCEMIVLQNGGIVTSKDLYQEALKAGFLEGKKIPNNPSGYMGEVARRTCKMSNAKIEIVRKSPKGEGFRLIG